MPKTSRYIADYLRERAVLLQDRGSSLSPPILLGLALHRWRIRILILTDPQFNPRLFSRPLAC
jgi:hypothetical protein